MLTSHAFFRVQSAVALQNSEFTAVSSLFVQGPQIKKFTSCGPQGDCELHVQYPKPREYTVSCDQTQSAGHQSTHRVVSRHKLLGMQSTEPRLAPLTLSLESIKGYNTKAHCKEEHTIYQHHQQERHCRRKGRWL